MQHRQGRNGLAAALRRPVEPASAQAQDARPAPAASTWPTRLRPAAAPSGGPARWPARRTAGTRPAPPSRGVRSALGRQNTVLVMNTRPSSLPAASIRSRSCPERPTKGWPRWSSSAPGPSPISMTGASAGPRANTVRDARALKPPHRKASMAASSAVRSAAPVAAARARPSASASWAAGSARPVGEGLGEAITAADGLGARRRAPSASRSTGASA